MDVARTPTAGQSGPLGWWRRWRASAARQDEERQVAGTLYRAVVAAAREPAIYAIHGVPDTPEARFEMVAVHLALLLRRLGQAGPPGAGLGRMAAEAMTQDMDRSVRELGVSDLSVGKYVKRLAASLNARRTVLDQAVALGDRSAIATMLANNAWLTGAPAPAELDGLVDRLLAFAAGLEAVPFATLAMGRLTNEAPPGR